MKEGMPEDIDYTPLREGNIPKKPTRDFKTTLALGAAIAAGFFGNGPEAKAGEVASHESVKPAASVVEKSALDDDHKRSIFVKEKKLIVYGMIETPDRRHGGIVPNTEREDHGRIVHDEARRVWGYEGQFGDIDRIDIYVCDASGVAIASKQSAQNGTDEYEKLLPHAMKFAHELDAKVYHDVFKDHPIGSVLKDDGVGTKG